MKADLRKTSPLLHYGILAFMYAIAAVTLFSHTLLHALDSKSGNETHTSVTCSSEHFHKHTMTFTAYGASPRSVTIARCDELTVVNKTSGEFKLAIGAHNHHADYPGFSETTLQPGASYSFRAAKTGTYPIHDHDNYELAGVMKVQ